MSIYKKSSKKSEIKVLPDEQDGTLPFVQERADTGPGVASAPDEALALGQLSVDVFQTADEIVIVAPVAGVRLSDLNISITDEVLEIRGKRNFQFKVQSGDYFTQECFWGSFSRSVILPDAVDVSRVNASFKNGILTVRVPKIEKIRTRMIKIKEE